LQAGLVTVRFVSVDGVRLATDGESESQAESTGTKRVSSAITNLSLETPLAEKQNPEYVVSRMQIPAVEPKIVTGPRDDSSR
jgi:hypothetical protein